MLADLSNEELTALWAFMADAPEAMYATWHGTQEGVLIDIGCLLWEVAEELDSRV